MMKNEIERLVNQYEPENIHIGVLGSHSALEIASGARQEGFQTVVVCQKGREKTYTRYYKNLFDHVILLDKFQDIIKPESLQKLNALQTVFVPNRSFSVYAGYENIEEKFTVPLMGNRYMLKTEERNTPRNQQYLLQKAGILAPRTFKSPEEIDRLAKKHGFKLGGFRSFGKAVTRKEIEEIKQRARGAQPVPSLVK